MVMEMMRKGAAGGLGKFILVGFMALAVGGLVLTDMGGFFRNGVSSHDVAKIGDQVISARQFDQTVRRSLAQVNITPEQAYKMGFIDRILNSEIGGAVLGIAAHDSGIVVSDALAAKQISRMIAPMAGPDGDLKTVLDRILVSQGMSEAAFVGSLKADMRNAFLAGSLESGFGIVSDELAKDLYRTKNQKRFVSYINFKNTDVKDIAPPTEEQLQTLYDGTKEQFSTPEIRDLKVIVLNTDALKDKIDVSDETLKARYESEKDLYTINESWVLEQALLDNMDSAKRIFEQVQSGKALDQAVKDVTGSATAYLGEKKFEADMLPETAKDQVLGTKEANKVLPPIETPLGFNVIKIRAYVPSGAKPFETVKADIKKEVLETQLIDQMYDQANALDDLLAGGATLDEVQEQADVNIVDVNGVTLFGGGSFGDLAPLQQDLIQMIDGLGEGETSAMQEMSDGRFMSVLVDKLTPKTYLPYEDAKAQLEQKWTADQQRVANRMAVKELLDQVSADTGIEALAKEKGKTVQKTQDLVRGTSKDDFPVYAVQSLFEAQKSIPIVADTNDGYAIAVVTDVKFPENIDDEALTAFKEELAKEQKNEVTMLYLNTKRDEYGVKINERILKQMYGGDQ